MIKCSKFKQQFTSFIFISFFFAVSVGPVLAEKHSKPHFKERLQKIPMQKEENLDFMMRLMDADRNGTVEFHEFLEIMAFLNYNKGLNARTAGQFFRALD